MLHPSSGKLILLFWNRKCKRRLKWFFRITGLHKLIRWRIGTLLNLKVRLCVQSKPVKTVRQIKTDCNVASAYSVALGKFKTFLQNDCTDIVLCMRIVQPQKKIFFCRRRRNSISIIRIRIQMDIFLIFFKIFPRIFTDSFCRSTAKTYNWQ